MLRLYDFPDPSIHGGQRVPTATPIQQLFALNSEFIQARAASLLERLKRECGSDFVSRVQQANRWRLGRPATAQEIAWARDFIRPERQSAGEEQDWRLYLHALLGGNEFMFVD